MNDRLMITGPAKQSTLNIGGMACNGCGDAVQNALQDLNGVESASVNLDSESALVSYDANAVSVDDFEKAIEEAGYEFEGINKLKVGS